MRRGGIRSWRVLALAGLALWYQANPAASDWCYDVCTPYINCSVTCQTDIHTWVTCEEYGWCATCVCGDDRCMQDVGGCFEDSDTCSDDCGPVISVPAPEPPTWSCYPPCSGANVTEVCDVGFKCNQAHCCEPIPGGEGGQQCTTSWECGTYEKCTDGYCMPRY